MTKRARQIITFVSTVSIAIFTIAIHAQDVQSQDVQSHVKRHNTDFTAPGHSIDLILPHDTALAKNKDIRIIFKLLSAQVQEWNAGNIDGFMHGYWENDSLVFIGSQGPRYGYKATLKRYKEAYPDKDHMGHLTSTITSIQRLSSEYYFIIGRWALTRKAGDIDGSYTLLLRKIKGEWVIVCDHSS